MFRAGYARFANGGADCTGSCPNRSAADYPAYAAPYTVAGSNEYTYTNRDSYRNAERDGIPNLGSANEYPHSNEYADPVPKRYANSNPNAIHHRDSTITLCTARIARQF